MARTFDADLLTAAVAGYEEQRRQIEARIVELRERVGNTTELTFQTAAARPVKKKNRLSAKGRARIAAAQKKRWEAAKKAKAEQGAPKQASSKSQKPTEGVKRTAPGLAKKATPKSQEPASKKVSVKRALGSTARKAAPKPKTQTPAGKKAVVKRSAPAKAAAKPVTRSQAAAKTRAAKPTEGIANKSSSEILNSAPTANETRPTTD